MDMDAAKREIWDSPSKAPNYTGTRALIVEDDLYWEPIWAHVLKVIDSRASYAWATSVSEAEQMMQKMDSAGMRFDLVISDIFVSGSQTGLDLLEKYGQHLEDCIMFVSGADKKLLESKMGSKSKYVILQKPFSIRECVSALKAVMSRKARSPLSWPSMELNN
jgi:response regulator of citrate/malate metabolism